MCSPFRIMLPIYLMQLLLVGIVRGQRPSSSHRSDVYIAGFFPYGDGVENAQTGKLIRFIIVYLIYNTSKFTGRGVMPSVKLALDHVNEHSTILRNYRLHMWWNDTEVHNSYRISSNKTISFTNQIKFSSVMQQLE